MMSRLFSLLLGTTTVLLLLVVLQQPVATTAFVLGVGADRAAANTGGSSLSALDPKKEIGVLPPIGFFE
jgi:hypothetical protein